MKNVNPEFGDPKKKTNLKFWEIERSDLESRKKMTYVGIRVGIFMWTAISYSNWCYLIAKKVNDYMYTTFTVIQSLDHQSCMFVDGVTVPKKSIEIALFITLSIDFDQCFF